MHIPRKRFGQHFLVDQTVISHIVRAIAPKQDEFIVEIGPGQGALTYPLLREVSHLEVIELDRDLIKVLANHAEASGKLNIHAADVLSVDFSRIQKDERLIRVVGNLPYNISTPLIFHLLKYASIIHDMVFMLQKEVAERLAAPVNSKHYGRLSVMVQYFCQVEILFHVEKEAFSPPPKVRSSIIKMLPYQSRPFIALDEELFAHLVKEAFAMRRKTLKNSLKSLVTDEFWQYFPDYASRRAEELSVSEFVQMSNILKQIKDRIMQ